MHITPVVILALGLARPAAAQAPTIEALPDVADWPYSTPRAVNSDGSVVVGRSRATMGQPDKDECYSSIRNYGAWWAPSATTVVFGEIEPVCGDPLATSVQAISPDGQYRAGTAGFVVDGTYEYANCRWTAASIVPEIFFTVSVNIVDVADNGTVIGYRTSPRRPWVSVGGGEFVLLDDTGDGEASGISGDGSTIVGWHASQAVRWDYGGGGWTRSSIAEGAEASYAEAISRDGSTIVGRWYEAGETRLFVKRDEGLTIVAPPGTETSISPIAVSADGSRVYAEREEPWVWDSDTGWWSLRQHLDDAGVLPEGWLVDVHGGDMSDDGLVVVGHDDVSSGVRRAWKITLSAETDSDGDGLLDDWEINGIPYGDGQRYVLPFADPMRKNLYVEVDAMAGFAPPSLDAVTGAFSLAPVSNPDGSTGITLYIEVDEVALDHDPLTIGPADAGFPPQFNVIRASHFGTVAEQGDIPRLAAKGKAYRYALMADTDTDTDLGVANGIPGSGFIVCIGEHADLCTTCTPAEIEEIIRSTFMHEFGHTLGLSHGGDQGEAFNYKPNYVSIMSYMEAVPYGLSHQLWRLDFSRGTLPDLNEQHLDELAGLVDPTGVLNGRRTYHGAIECADVMCDPVSADTVEIQAIDVGTLAVDWNDDGRFEPNACGDLNFYGAATGFPGAETATPCQVMRDHDDWGALQYAIPDSAPLPGEEIHELTGDMVRAFFEILPTPCYADVTRDGQVDVADLLDVLSSWGACAACPADVEPRLIADERVDVQDLLVVLSSWGDCP